MTPTAQTLSDSIRIVGAARDVTRSRIVAIIKQRAAAHRAKKNNLISSLIAAELESLAKEITATKQGDNHADNSKID